MILLALPTILPPHDISRDEGTTRPPGLLVKWLCFLFYLILFPSTL
jgi:hypothetical protein